MMRKFFILIGLLAFHIIIWAQREIREGYCVTPSNDTLFGRFLIPVDVEEKINLARLQWKVYLLDDKGALTIFKPGELDSFCINDSLETFQYYNLELYSDNFVFIRLLSDGYMRLYVHYTEMLAGGWDQIHFTNNFLTYPRRSEEDYFVVQKPGEDLIKVRPFSMYRKLSGYISEYNELASRIREKEYVFTDIFRIVREYNEWQTEQGALTSWDNNGRSSEVITR